MQTGDKVKTKKGQHGTIHSTHNGPYYGVNVGGNVSYLPAAHVEPEAEPSGTANNPDPDHDGDNDMTASNVTPVIEDPLPDGDDDHDLGMVEGPITIKETPEKRETKVMASLAFARELADRRYR